MSKKHAKLSELNMTDLRARAKKRGIATTYLSGPKKGRSVTKAVLVRRLQKGGPKARKRGGKKPAAKKKSPAKKKSGGKKKSSGKKKTGLAAKTVVQLRKQAKGMGIKLTVASGPRKGKQKTKAGLIAAIRRKQGGTKKKTGRRKATAATDPLATKSESKLVARAKGKKRVYQYTLNGKKKFSKRKPRSAGAKGVKSVTALQAVRYMLRFGTHKQAARLLKNLPAAPKKGAKKRSSKKGRSREATGAASTRSMTPAAIAARRKVGIAGMGEAFLPQFVQDDIFGIHQEAPINILSPSEAAAQKQFRDLQRRAGFERKKLGQQFQEIVVKPVKLAEARALPNRDDVAKLIIRNNPALRLKRSTLRNRKRGELNRIAAGQAPIPKSAFL